MNAHEHPMVRLEWVDSGLSYALTWDDEETLVARAKNWDGHVTTVGFLLYEDERCVAIAQNHDERKDGPDSGNWAQVMLVGRANVRSMTTLVSGGPRPLASAPATSSEEPSATPAAPTLADAHRFVSPGPLSPGGRVSFCPAHVRYEIRGTHKPFPFENPLSRAFDEALDFEPVTE